MRVESVFGQVADGEEPTNVTEVAVTDKQGIAHFQDGRTVWLQDHLGHRVETEGSRITRTMFLRGAHG